MNRGFLIVAQNTKDVDYVFCAEVLAKNIKKLMPESSVSLLTNNTTNSLYVDNVINFPYGDLDKNGLWKLKNDWQVYEASPYDLTIKIEADVYLPQSIEYWWDILEKRDLVVCNTIRNYKQEIVESSYYRRFIENNKLPNVYNAITYFKKSDTAKKFFEIVRDVFENWLEYKKILQCNTDEIVTTDWAYAIAAHIIGVENCTIPNFREMSMVHMKQLINGLPTENWTDTLIYEINQNCLRINTYPQMYPFHYHIKTFSEKLARI